MILTVIFRDDAPVIHVGGSPAYRSIRIELTPEQETKIRAAPPGPWGKSSSEDIDKCFIEPAPAPQTDRGEG